MLLRKSTAVRIPIRLLDSTGLPVTGIGDADFASIAVIKSDSSVTAFTPDDGVNWFEVDSTAAPGLYHLLLSSAHTNTNGPLQVALISSASQFNDTVAAAVVEDISSNIATLTSLVTILKKAAVNKMVIYTSGPNANKQIVFDDDGVTELFSFDLFDDSGVPTATNPFRRDPA